MAGRVALLAGVLLVAAAPGAAAERPRGTILYAQEVGGSSQLFSLRPDGTGRRQLTRGPADAMNAEWSPDGRLIAFERFVPAERRAAVAVMAADGRRVRDLTPIGFQGDPSFSPDGEWIVFTRDPAPGDNGIWLMKTDGSGLRRLTRNPFSCCDEGAAVSPDGRTVTFARSRRSGRDRALYAIGIDGRKLRQLTDWHFGPPRHAWSPDGSRIVITLERADTANVFTIRPDGTDVRPVTRFTAGAARNAYAGSYSPDGSWLAVRIEHRGSFRLCLVRPDGTGLHRIATAASRQSGLDWGATG